MAAEGARRAADVLAERASQIGEAWAEEYVRDLQVNERSPVGSWPGTMTEARGRVLVQLAVVLAPERLHELAHIAIGAARRGWRKVCERDLEI